MSRSTRSLRRNTLSMLVQFSLPAMLAITLGHAATCTVNSALDDPADATAKVSGTDPAGWTNWGSGATGAISLRDCILASNLMTGATGVPTTPGMTIVLDAIAGSTVTLSDALPLMFNTTSVGVTGSPVTIDGNGHRIFFVSGLPSIPGSGLPNPDDAQAVTVAFYNLVLKNGLAQGGSGHAGGLGAGGALFVNKNATVTTDHVDFATNSASGGAGASGASYIGGGGMGGGAGARGGGGLGGSNVNAGFSFGGGIGTDSGSGGGGFGGTGVGQLSSAQGFAAPNFGGSTTFVQPNGGIGGGGYRYGAGGFGGGGGANSSGGTPTSPGGFGGGGGAPGEGGGGAGGGFGGGGGAMGSQFFSYNSAGQTGATGASGGFGAGGAGGQGGGGCFIGGTGATGPFPGGAGGPGGPGGVGGGIGASGTDGVGCGSVTSSNGVDGAGGGGAGLGGAVFVRSGGALLIQQTSGAGSISGNTVTAGVGGAAGPTSAAGNGAAAGSGLFLMSGATTTFLVDTTQTISDNIADDSLVSLPSGGSYTQGNGSGAALSKAGTGTLIFAAGTNHTYTGPTTIDTGTLQLDGSVMSPITINGGGTLSGVGSAQGVTLNSAGIIAPGDSPGTLFGNNLTWNGDSAGNAQMNFQLGATSSSVDSDRIVLNNAFNKGTAGTFKFHFTDGNGGPPTPGTTYTLVQFNSHTFLPDASDFTFDYSGAFAGALSGKFVLTGNAAPPPAPITSQPRAALPPNALTFAVAAIPPTIGKAFAPTTIPLNGTTTLTFNIGNPNSTTALNNISFSDPLPAGLAVAATPNVSNTCGGTFAPVASDTSLTFSGGTLAISASCSISVDVTGSTAGQKNNTSSGITATESLAAQGTAAAASVTVIAPPGFAKAFSPTAIGPAGTSTLTFTIQNTNATALSGVNFTDTFPAGLVVAVAPNATDTCGGTFAPTAGAGSVSLTGGTVNANASCTLSVDVHGTVTGTLDNTAGPISSTEGGTGGTAAATLTINTTPVRLQSFEVN